MASSMTDIAVNPMGLPPANESIVLSKKAKKVLSSFTRDESFDEQRAESCSWAYSKRYPVPEDQLIVAAQNGISDAIEELLNRNRTMIYRTAYRMTGNAQEAEDVVQETMLRALKNIERFRGEARLSSWLIAIAVNTVLTSRRKAKHIRWTSLDEPVGVDSGVLRAESLCDNHMNPEQECLDKERRVIVRRAIAGQHPKFRVILRSCDLNEVPIEEVARTLRITSAAAKSRLFRARQTLLSTIRKQIGNRELQ